MRIFIPFIALSLSALSLLAACDKETDKKSEPDKPARTTSTGTGTASGKTTPAADTTDHSSELKEYMEGMLKAVGSGDADAVEPLLLGMAMTPEDAAKWFAEVFGPELGAKLAKAWEDEIFANLPKLVRPFKEANKEGRTEVSVVRVASASDANANGAQQAALGKMVKPTALYTVKLNKPGETSGSSLWSFAYVDGGLRLVGEMKAVK